jgi:uncharacterized protein (DUF2236 family)
MDTDGDNVLKNGDWWLNEKIAFLLRPAGALRTLNSLGHGDAQILMQRYEPVLLNGLYKHRALHNLSIRRQQTLQTRIYSELFGELAARRRVQQLPQAVGCVRKACD